ncbi:MAG: cyclic nucleotide-binding domain-containing protein, partial [Acidobacteriota bacterium]
MNNLFPRQSDHPLFRYFTDEERRRVEHLAELRTVNPNEELIRAGDNDATLFAVEDGHLDIVAMVDDQPTVVATVGPGDVLGEVAFIDDSARSVTVRAGELTLVRAWDKRTLSESLA